MMKRLKDFCVTPMISNHAVLQRSAVIVARGEGMPGATVLGWMRREEEPVCGWGNWETERQGIIGNDGMWKLEFPPLPAGGPYGVRFVCEESRLEFSDIYIGDVWVLAGQSNMQLPMERVKYRFPKEYQEGASPMIRQFAVPVRWDFEAEAKELTGGAWSQATPANTAAFSAVGFFFGRRLWEHVKVPVGLILTAVGGTPIQAWLSRDVLQKFPDDVRDLDTCRDTEYLERVQKEDGVRSENWWKKLDRRDRGLKEKWMSRAEDIPWKRINPAADWSQSKDLAEPGVIWLRKVILISPERAGKPVRLSLGTMADADFTYVNGKLAGNIGYRYPPREYELSGLHQGENVITVRLVVFREAGGFTEGKELALNWKDGGEKQLITGDWEYRRGAFMQPLQEQTFFERKPAGMYQGMIAPLHDFQIKGVCWYQGEMNADEDKSYPDYFASMVFDWRKKWRSSIPVLFVQLPNYDLYDAGKWVQFRHVQQRLTLIHDTAMVVTIDCGEDNDLHPTDKKTVGERLAMAAFTLVYGEPGPWISPLFSYSEESENGLLLHFKHAEEGLGIRGGELTDGFEVCFMEKVFPAKELDCLKFQIQGDTVRVDGLDDCEESVTSIRYGWFNRGWGANLCGSTGLPVAPFVCMTEHF